jgi:site-specific recombinase XerD
MTGGAENTCHSHYYALHHFIAWCDERGLQHPPELTHAYLLRYQEYLYDYRKVDGKPLNPGTQGQRLCAIRALFRWLF